MKLLGLLPDNSIEYISVKIHGDSMFPSFSDGDTVVFKTIDNAIVLVGDIVLAIHPFKKKINIVKRVTKINSCDEYFWKEIMRSQVQALTVDLLGISQKKILSQY